MGVPLALWVQFEGCIVEFHKDGAVRVGWVLFFTVGEVLTVELDQSEVEAGFTGDGQLKHHLLVGVFGIELERLSRETGGICADCCVIEMIAHSVQIEFEGSMGSFVSALFEWVFEISVGASHGKFVLVEIDVF
jgi:hypothetical protein